MHQGRQTTHFEIENHLTYFLLIREGISALNIFVHIHTIFIFYKRCFDV